ncbi:hypothetical protein ATR1_363d0001, partial [Acetobacter tropicalis]
MPWPGCQQTKPFTTYNLTQTGFRQGDAIALMQPGAQIAQSPADNTMHRRNWPFFEPGFQGRQHLWCQAGFLSPAMTIHKAIR